MQIRLIAMDLDGTALTSQRVPHPDLPPLLREAQSQGFEICLATGRNLHSLRRVAPLFEVDAHFISANGCMTIDKHGTSVDSRRLNQQALSRVLEYCESTGAYIHGESPGEMIALREGPERALYESRSKVPVRPAGAHALLDSEMTHLLLIDEPERMADHYASLSAVAGDDINLIFSEKEYLEILPAGVDKSVGLRALCDHLNIEQCETAAIGDYDNDHPMLRWVGFPAAVGNARPIVLEAAKMVFLSNDEGGASEFVRYIVYNDRERGTH